MEDILNLAKDKDLDKKAITLLIDGVISDLNCVHIANEEELTRYSFQVAGTVGMLMNQLLGSKEACAKKFAIDLGIAMQLTNILRDVAEDASLGRQYIPQSWLPQGLDFLKPTNAQDEALKASLYRLFLLAEQYYQSGYAGIRYLPMRNRFCVLLAARMYQEIGKRSMRQDFKRWEKRMIVPKSSKFKLMCLCSLDFLKSLFSVKKPIRHNERLHHVFTQWLNPE